MDRGKNGESVGPISLQPGNCGSRPDSLRRVVESLHCRIGGSRHGSEGSYCTPNKTTAAKRIVLFGDPAIRNYKMREMGSLMCSFKRAL